MKQSSSKIDISTFASLHWRNLLPPKTNPKSLRTFSHTHHQLNIKRHLTPCPTAPKNLQTLTPRLEVRTPEAGEKISAAQISNKGASRRVSFWDGLKLHEPRRRLRAWASLTQRRSFQLEVSVPKVCRSLDNSWPKVTKTIIRGGLSTWLKRLSPARSRSQMAMSLLWARKIRPCLSCTETYMFNALQ